MEKRVDVLVIGAGPGGMVSALTAKRYYPEKKILVMKSIEKGVIPCGIPYMFVSLKTPEENRLGNVVLEKNNIEVIVDTAVKIDRNKKRVETKNNHLYYYEKLILATGSLPVFPPIAGIKNKENIYPIYKDMEYLKPCVEKVKRSRNVLIVGGGFIGVEFADEISKIEGINVYLVEILPNLLMNCFDDEFSKLAEEKLKARGVFILTNTEVKEFIGSQKVEKAILSDGREIEVDSVILGVGAVPNTELAIDAGLGLGKGKGVWVDEYMRTTDPDIFAVGDCAEKYDFFTRRDIRVMLASIATSEARVAGANLYNLKVVRENKGTIPIYLTYIDGLVLGSAGFTERNAGEEKIEVTTGFFEGVDKHPSTLPGVSKIKVKLIFSKRSNVILGGQVAGGVSCAELINLIGIAIQKRLSLAELETLQIATHPYLTSAPTVYPIIVAAQNAAKLQKE